VKQIKGEYRVKDLSLKELFLQVDSLLSQAKGKWHIKHIRRAFNKQADQLCNLALDKNQEVSL
jgi:ribonuclease HI